jgi:hypothetical protein
MLNAISHHTIKVSKGYKGWRGQQDRWYDPRLTGTVLIVTSVTHIGYNTITKPETIKNGEKMVDY